MRTNAFVPDLGVPDANAGDGRRLEVVVDGLPLFGGGQLAVDTTLVCALHGDGRPRRGAAEMDGVVRASSTGRPDCGSWGQVFEGDVWVRAGEGSGTE